MAAPCAASFAMRSGAAQRATQSVRARRGTVSAHTAARDGDAKDYGGRRIPLDR